MAFTVMTRKFSQATFRLLLTADGSAWLTCKPVVGSKLAEITRNVLAEAGFDQSLAAAMLPGAMLQAYVTGWQGLVDIHGDEIPYSEEMLREICEHDPEFAEQQLGRLRRIAREGRLEEEKN